MSADGFFDGLLGSMNKGGNTEVLSLDLFGDEYIYR